jgi:thiaminase (transcriptional activator TenA)
LLDALAELAPRIGVEPPAARSPIAPNTHAYCSFLHAGTTTTFAAGIGTLLPMMWFHLEICGDLRNRGKPGSRYAPWIEVYDPGEGTWHAVQAFLDMIEEVGERSSATERARLIEHFSLGMRHEWAFAEGGLRPLDWPV